MPKLNVFVAEDEGPARRKLLRFLAEEPEIVVVGEAADGPSAAAGILETGPDLAFLDIQMPGKSGLDVAREVSTGSPPAIVFLTAYDEFALQAFEVHALDYLLKPYDQQKFRAVLRRIQTLVARPADLADKIESLLRQASPEPKYVRRLLIHDNDRAFFLPVEELDRLEAARNYVSIYAHNRTYLQRCSLEQFASRLDPALFAQINRSNVVRLEFIKELRPWFHGEYHAVLRDGVTLTWSRRFRRPELSGF